MQAADYIIYLDNNSTTKTDNRVIEKILPFMKDLYGNPSSSHNFGKKTNQHIKDARSEVSNLINCDSNEIVFTSGATEAINLAIKGLVQFSDSNRKKIVTISTEHKAVLDTCRSLERHGYDVIYLPVLKDGCIDINQYKSVIDDSTLLVIGMLVNNETGVIHDIDIMSGLAHEVGAYFFCDATQAVGKIEVDVNNLGIDLLCFSGHKFHAPTGVGGLYIDTNLKNKIQPQLNGGGQESGIRSGSLNTIGIIGLGEACKLASNEMKLTQNNIGGLRDVLEIDLLKLPNTFINGNIKKRIFNTTNICFPNNDANVLIGKLKNISLSNGSACTSLIVEPSHVLTAMGLNEELAFSAIRFSLSKFNTIEDVKKTIQEITNILIRL